MKRIEQTFISLSINCNSISNQTTWTRSRSYNTYPFGALLAEMSTDRKGERSWRNKKIQLSNWRGWKNDIHLFMPGSGNTFFAFKSLTIGIISDQMITVA